MRILLLVVFSLFFVGVASATLPSCYVTASSCGANITMGKVTTQGHFGVVGYDGGLNLCCPVIYDATPEVPVFKLHGSQQGHVSSLDYPFGNNISFGENTFSCTPRSGGCLEGSSSQRAESCLFRMASENNSHIASCEQPNVPYANDYDIEMCCSFNEICDNNIDDTGDGFVDCASPTCHPSALTGGVPQECSGNDQTTAYCLENPGDCSGPGGLPYYCSYGISDDPSVQPQGFCCPASTYAQLIPGVGWECTDTTECGIGLEFWCEYRFEENTERPDWLESTYYGDTEDWCVSQYPEFFDPQQGAGSRSAACCLIDMYGENNYYVADRNVRVFG